MTSLTPNEDAYLAARAAGLADVEKACAQPGPRGMEARVIIAANEAVRLALMREVDRGASPDDAVKLLTTVAANMLVMLVELTGFSPNGAIGLTASKVGYMCAGRGEVIQGGSFTPSSVHRA